MQALNEPMHLVFYADVPWAHSLTSLLNSLICKIWMFHKLWAPHPNLFFFFKLSRILHREDLEWHMVHMVVITMITMMEFS